MSHEKVEIVAVSSRSEVGKPVAQLFPNLKNYLDICFSDPKDLVQSKPDVVFFATPHGVAQRMMKDVAAEGIKVIDLSADFRIRDQKLWETWYGQEHQSPEYISQAVYGLPEVNRQQISQASLVACPGCYPTSIQFCLLYTSPSPRDQRGSRMPSSA